MNTRLHVNVDHVATLRNARGTVYPDPVEAALICESAGAHGITMHLREDRRHIRDEDLINARAKIKTLLNMEMAATPEMISIAKRVRPNLVTLVPEKREERTTEGGLDVRGHEKMIAAMIAELAAAKIPTSLFIDPHEEQIRASVNVGARGIELHTGDYANAYFLSPATHELSALKNGAEFTSKIAPAMEVAAGHGLTRENVFALLIAAPNIVELNVGHAIVADAVFMGMENAVRAFQVAMLGAPR